MEKPTELERAVLQKLLSGESPILAVLRRQAELASVGTRDLTGDGFMTSFSLPDNVEPAPVRSGTVRFGDVAAQLPGVKNGAGFLLYVKDGKLDALEGYTYDDPWPEQVGGFTLSYIEPGQRDFGDLQT
jgi:hypothetical protein